ncbi:hypothetical protein HMI56_004626, partial [Coelomomyces lativittatus]
YHYFDEEEVDAKDWIVSWLQFVLAKELPLECLLRLWDTYFSEPEGFDLHPFVCLALLQQMKDALEELESSEICSLLQRIRFRPEDMDNLIHMAKNLRLDTLQHSENDHRSLSR